MNDVVDQSNGEVGLEDIILAPTFFTSGLFAVWNAMDTIKDLIKLNPGGLLFGAILGELVEFAVNLIKDSALWAAEMFDPNTMGTAAINVWNAIESYFLANEADRARDLVGVGYSGGFLTLGEVLVNSVYNADLNRGFNAVSLVGLGGLNIQLDGPYRKVLDKMLGIGEFLLKGSVKTAEFLNNLRVELDALAALAIGPAGAASLNQVEADQIYQELVNGTIESAYQAFLTKTQEKTMLWSGFEPALNATSNIGVVVNVFGTRDFVTQWSIPGTGQTIGGYRDNIGQYTTVDRDHQLVNIEIVGASHFDYIRPEEKNEWWKSGLLGSVANAVDWFQTTEDEIWNETVSAFAAQLINNSQSAEDIGQFLNDNPTIASFDGQKWIIRLPGWESRA
jgi:hypothetical protein